MQYRPLGRSGLKISPICLGTMMFGGPTDEATSTRIVAKAREAGINFIDTADAYNGGNSEQVVGRAISNSRHNWVLATKLANPMGDDPNRGGLAGRRDLQHLRPPRHRPPGGQPALLQCDESHARGRAFSSLPFLRPRHRAL
jgi:aryl-alcohol dehydrogenase-like predicted oxidoreductase